MIRKLIAAGLPVLPILDKNTPLVKHLFLDSRLPTEEDYKSFLDNKEIAIKTGNDQTKIECIDFDLKNDDSGELWKEFSQTDLTGLYIEQTPSLGYHVVYKCDKETGPSQKLAYPKTGNKATIETRGRGGYFACAPSKGYKVIQGDLFNLPILSLEEIDNLKTICRSLNKQPDRDRKKERSTNTQKIFNRQYSNVSLDYLMSQGWTINKEHPDRFWLTRPGKTKGTSGTLYKDSGYFYSFTNSTEYESNKAYSPFYFLKLSKKLTTHEAEKEVCRIVGDPFTKELIIEILKNGDKLKEIELVNKLKNTIIEDMKKNGTFYSDGDFGYYFVDCKLISLDIKNESVTNFIYEKYDLVKTQTKIVNIFESIRKYALTQGEKTKIHKYCYYSGDAVYIDNFNGKLWKISEKDIDLLNNGTDGVLFLESRNTPVIYDDSSMQISELLFEGLDFDEETLKKDEQEKLLAYWLLSIFFLQENKPILCVVGEKGSGKSDILKKIIYLLFGNANALSIVPDKVENFWATVTNNKMMVFDNADGSRDWLNDALSMCATGGVISLRKLYTTNEFYYAPIDCFIGLTSRTPKFTRDDVADRLLFVKLNRIKSFTSEMQIMNKIRANRNAFMSMIFETIKTIIPKLKNNIENHFSRMGDFECFCRSFDETMTDTFKRLVEEQKEFSEDTFVDVFRTYCKEYSEANFSGNEFIKTAFELSCEITKKAESLNIKSMKLTSKNIAYKLRRDYDFCKINREPLPHNKSQYKITLCPSN